jgi:hypothetical protein
MALSSAQAEFLRRLKDGAALSEARGVPAAVVIAQGIIESGWGTSELTRQGNAAFGIKAGASWPGAVYSGTTYEFEGGRSVKYHGTNRVYASRAEALAAGAHPATIFRAYRSLAESLLDHCEFFHQNRRYHPCLEAYARDRDPRAFAACIHRAGYATSPTYTQTLIRTMEAHCPELLAPRPPVPGAPPAPLPPQPVRVVVHGRALPAEAVEFRDGRIWVLVRPAFEAAGLRVAWKAEDRVVEVES